jgi:exosortase/archaeosortase family protein
MEKNVKLFMIKSGVFLGILLAVSVLFRFSFDFFTITALSMNEATRIFSKSDALKVIALSVLFFGLYYKDKIARISHEKQNNTTIVILIMSGLMMISFYYFLRYIANAFNVVSGFYFYLIFILSLISLVFSFAFFAVSVFSWNYIMRFYEKFKVPVFVTSLLALSGYFLLMFFQGLWPMFVYPITKILFFLFRPFYPVYMELHEAPLMDVDGFVVSIGAACSGIESLFLFVAFSIGIFVLDHEKLNKNRFLIYSVIGIIGIYFVNILRLFLLILTGVHISPEFAVGIFHSNIGWLMFVIYFAIYYYFMRKFIYKKTVPKEMRK